MRGPGPVRLIGVTEGSSPRQGVHDLKRERERERERVGKSEETRPGDGSTEAIFNILMPPEDARQPNFSEL